MNSDIAVNFLAELFRSHGIQSSIDGDWVLPESSPHAIRALWHPRDTSGRLDVHVLVGDELVIEECFAGIGAGELGLNDALANFTINSFHVLLAALWNLDNASQVTTESWSINGASYTAHIGNCGTRASEGVEPFIPRSLFPAIAKAIQTENLQGELHWFRFFFCNVAGEFTFESLRDNEEWNRGTELLQEIPWEPSPGYYSVRLFLMLRIVQSAPAKRRSPFDRARDFIFKRVAQSINFRSGAAAVEMANPNLPSSTIGSDRPSAVSRAYRESDIALSTFPCQHTVNDFTGLRQ